MMLIETFGTDALGPTAGAAVTVLLVLVEAIALYVGYGALARTVGETVLDALGGD
ncbi:MAG: hypothetical protein ABEJ81_04795 [Haloferacaceae archaeon]